jgi:transposase
MSHLRLVVDELGKELLSGDLFVFTNKVRSLAKVLYFDGSGLCILQKRLERGRFASLWQHSEHGSIPLKHSELSLFLEGSDLIGRFRVSPDVLSVKELAPKMQT